MPSLAVDWSLEIAALQLKDSWIFPLPEKELAVTTFSCSLERSRHHHFEMAYR